MFGAWTNLVDMKAGNTLDMVVTENGRAIVKHYLQDVGSTFGTGALDPRDGDEGYEDLVRLRRGDEGALHPRACVLRPGRRSIYEKHPEIGRFEASSSTR